MDTLLFWSTLCRAHTIQYPPASPQLSS
jgi:hypothetical protein